MKVFLTRPNHLLRAPTMAHCYDSRRALPHRERRTTAQPLFNCVLISAPANIRMRRQRTGVRWGKSTSGCPTSTLRSSRFFWHRPASCCYRLDSRWSRGRALRRAFFCCFLKSCVRACESELVTGSPQRGRDYLIQPALLIGWVGGGRNWTDSEQRQRHFLLLPSAKVPICYSPSQDPNMFTITYSHYCCSLIS